MTVVTSIVLKTDANSRFNNEKIEATQQQQQAWTAMTISAVR